MQDILQQLLSILDAEELSKQDFEIIQRPTVTDTKFRVDEAATAVCIAGGLLTSRIWEMQTGETQKVRVNTAHAAMTLFSFMLQTQNGYPICYPDTHRTWPKYPIMDAYRARDGRFVYIDGVYPHLRDGLLDILESPNNAPSLARAVARFDSEELEREINERELCGTIVRSYEDWCRHPQGQMLANMPPVKISKLSTSDPIEFQGGNQPLAGVRVLDLTHVLAGPMATRALAGQGAEVLHISGPNVFELFPFTIDTGHGKRNAFLDFKRSEDREQLRHLIERADLFVQAYAPGKLADFGFGMEDLCPMKDRIIYCTLSCYGTEGPCGRWGGFEQLGQAASGLMAAHSSIDEPELVPAAVCDYLTGYLATIGILGALIRRATEGGSYHVEVSLSRTGMWIQELGLRADAKTPGQIPAHELESLMMDSKTCFGTIHHLKPVVEFSKTPPKFFYPVSALGSSPAAWADEAS